MGVLVTIGWWLLARFVPPPLPSWGGQEIAGMFAANATGIRVGMIFMIAGMGFFMPFIALISAQIHRMEGSPPVLAYTQLLAGAMSVAIVLFPVMFWATAAFRPDRDPQLILMLNDSFFDHGMNNRVHIRHTRAVAFHEDIHYNT